MTIRYRPLPFGTSNTNGRHDYKIIFSDEPIATSRATRRLMDKMARKNGNLQKAKKKRL